MSQAMVLMLKGVISELSDEDKARHDSAYSRVREMYDTDPDAMGTAMSLFLLEKQVEQNQKNE